MTLQTAFNIGDAVQVREGTKNTGFIIDEIKIETLDKGRLILIQYRSAQNPTTGRNGKWYAEKECALLRPSRPDDPEFSNTNTTP